MPDDKSLYNLKLVLKETGIKADVLRAWERRYGLPKPQRSPGGHRLYSQHDIAIIKWLIARQNEGLSISNAVKLWREKGTESQFLPAGSQPIQLAGVTSDTTIEMLRKNWVAACTEFNEPSSEQVLNLAFSLYPVEMVVSEIIQHGMRDFGEMWYDGDATVQQEHFTSAVALRRLETLITAVPSPTRPETILLACPSEEWHTLSLVTLNLFLRRRGYHVVFLGANVPSENLQETADNIHPDLVILASQQLASTAQLQKSARMLSQRQVQVAYGGRIFNAIPAIQNRISGHFLGRTLEDALVMIEPLILSPRLSPKVEEISFEYRQLASDFYEKRGLIEAGTLEEIKKHVISTEYLSEANRYLGNELGSALELGNIDYLTADMTWLKGLLLRHHVQVERLNPYLMTYGESARKVMNGYSSIFTKWIDSIVEEI